MTTTQTTSLIGQRGQLIAERDKLQITVTIQDARSCYGRTEVLVSPKDGSGKAWVSIDRVSLAQSPSGP